MCFPTRGSKKKKKWLTWQAWDSPCNPQRMCGRMGLNTAHHRCPWATASAKGAVKSAGASGREDSTAVGLEGPIAQVLQENINLSLHAVLGTIENGWSSRRLCNTLKFLFCSFPWACLLCYACIWCCGPCLMGISCYQSKGVNCGYPLHMLTNIISICETRTRTCYVPKEVKLLIALIFVDSVWCSSTWDVNESGRRVCEWIRLLFISGRRDPPLCVPPQDLLLAN